MVPSSVEGLVAMLPEGVCVCVGGVDWPGNLVEQTLPPGPLRTPVLRSPIQHRERMGVVNMNHLGMHNIGTPPIRRASALPPTAFGAGTVNTLHFLAEKRNFLSIPAHAMHNCCCCCCCCGVPKSSSGLPAVFVSCPPRSAESRSVLPGTEIEASSPLFPPGLIPRCRPAGDSLSLPCAPCAKGHCLQQAASHSKVSAGALAA